MTWEDEYLVDRRDLADTLTVFAEPAVPVVASCCGRVICGCDESEPVGWRSRFPRPQNPNS